MLNKQNNERLVRDERLEDAKLLLKFHLIKSAAFDITGVTKWICCVYMPIHHVVGEKFLKIALHGSIKLVNLKLV